MKISKVWEKALEFLDSNKKKDREKRECMKEVLKKLKKHEDQLEEELKAASSGSKSKKLRKELDVVQAQQEKAANIIKNL